MRVLFFGDSITYGAHDPDGGWVQQIRAQYEALPTNQHEFYNLGISGDVASGIVKRLALETESRRWFNEELVIVIAIGINDAQYHNNKPVSEPELYKGELQQLLAAMHQYTTRCMFVGLTPVDDSLQDPTQHEFGYRNERVREFDAVLREFCTDHGVPVAEIFDDFHARHERESLLTDGLHPNQAGHRMIAESVLPELKKLLNK